MLGRAGDRERGRHLNCCTSLGEGGVGVTRGVGREDTGRGNRTDDGLVRPGGVGAQEGTGNGGSTGSDIKFSGCDKTGKFDTGDSDRVARDSDNCVARDVSSGTWGMEMV